MALIHADVIQMFFVSPRNSLDAFIKMFEAGNVNKFILPNQPLPITSQIFERRPSMQVLQVPELDTLLDETPVAHVPLNKSFEELRFKPLLWLHTSGSTGTPKIVPLKHGYPTSSDAYSRLPFNEQAHRCGDTRLFNPFPPSHMAGIVYSLPVVVFHNSTVVFPPTNPLTGQLVNKVHMAANVGMSMIPPAVITELSHEPEYLENLRRLKGLNFAGGPLPHAVGEKVRQFVTLHNSIGATEYFTLPFLPKDSEDWSWLRFDMAHAGIEFRPSGDEGLCEMVHVRNPALDLQQAIFVTFPDIDEYGTKDLFAQHPTKPDHWQYRGRLDDVIVFSSGEKINPVTMEGTVCTAPEVKGAVVVGQGRFQPALLLEPKTNPDTDVEEAELIDSITPYLDRANESSIGHGRIRKDMIILTSPDKPLPRAGKGTVQRAAANALYAPEIEELFTNGRKDAQISMDMSSASAAKQSLTRYLDEELDLGLLKAHEDFFQAGMDSIQTISLLHAVNTSISGRTININKVYDNPTIEQLTGILFASEDEEDSGSDSDDDLETWKTMQKLYESVGNDLPGVVLMSGLEKFFRPSRQNQTVMPSDGGSTAWLQVLACFLINLNNWGLVNSWAPFQAYYEGIWPDKSASDIAWIGTVQGALLLMVGVISGPLFDTGYFKITLISSSVVLVFTLMMLSLADQYWQVMLTQGILAGMCNGLLFIPSISLVSLYFTRKRGFALGIATSGGALGGIIYPIIFRFVLTHHGFGWAVRVIGFTVLITLAAGILIAKPIGAMRQPSRQLIDTTAFKELPFIAFMLAGFLVYCGLLVPFFLSTTFDVSVHANQDTAFYLIAVTNAGQFLGRIFPPLLSDIRWDTAKPRSRWLRPLNIKGGLGPEVLLLLSQLLAGFLCLCWIAVTDTPGFTAWSFFYGIASGAVATLAAAVLPYTCPSLSVVGTRFGMLYGISGVGLLISNPIATAAISSEGSYVGAQVWSGLTVLAGVGFFAVTLRDARGRRVVMEDEARRGRRGMWRRRKGKGRNGERKGRGRGVREMGEKMVGKRWGRSEKKSERDALARNVLQV